MTVKEIEALSKKMEPSFNRAFIDAAKGIRDRFSRVIRLF